MRCRFDRTKIIIDTYGGCGAHGGGAVVGVHVGKDDLHIGAGDQNTMFRYRGHEAEDVMPLTQTMATRLTVCTRTGTSGGCGQMVGCR